MTLPHPPSLFLPLLPPYLPLFLSSPCFSLSVLHVGVHTMRALWRPGLRQDILLITSPTLWLSGRSSLNLKLAASGEWLTSKLLHPPVSSPNNGVAGIHCHDRRLGIQTWVLMLTKQAFYPGSPLPSPKVNIFTQEFCVQLNCPSSEKGDSVCKSSSENT